MPDQENTFANSFFELADLFRSFSQGKSNERVVQFLGKTPDQAIEAIQKIETLFRGCSRDLMASQVDYDVLTEYLSVVDKYRSSFRRAILSEHSVHFINALKPAEKADILRTMGQFVQHASKGKPRVSLQRAELLKDLTSVTEDLNNSELSDLVKEVVALNLRAVKAMVATTNAYSDDEIRSKIREIVYEYVAAFEKADSKNSNFTEKLMNFVRKHGASSVGYVALASDVAGSAEFVMKLLGHS